MSAARCAADLQDRVRQEAALPLDTHQCGSAVAADRQPPDKAVAFAQRLWAPGTSRMEGLVNWSYRLGSILRLCQVALDDLGVCLGLHRLAFIAKFVPPLRDSRSLRSCLDAWYPAARPRKCGPAHAGPVSREDDLWLRPGAQTGQRFSGGAQRQAERCAGRWIRRRVPGEKLAPHNWLGVAPMGGGAILVAKVPP